MTRLETWLGLRRRNAKTQGFAFISPRLMVSALKAFGVVFLVCALAAGQQQSPAPPVPDAFATRRATAEAAHEGHRAKLFVELAHDEMEAADKAFTNGNADLGQALAANAGNDAEEGGKAALDSGKRLKDTEIELRKLQFRTRDISRSLSFDDRPPVNKIVDRIEAMREAILTRMFGPRKKGK